MLKCPVCDQLIAPSLIEVHVDRCLNQSQIEGNSTATDTDVGRVEAESCDSSQIISQHSQVGSHKPGSSLIESEPFDSARSDGDKKKSWSFLKSSPVASTSRSTQRTSLYSTSKSPAVNSSDPETHGVPPSKRSKTVDAEVCRSEGDRVNTAFADKAQLSTKATSASKRDSGIVCPLAEQMRPTCLGEFVGQESVLGRFSSLRKILELRRFTSLILWGPPGCGKTSLARLIARQCDGKSGWRFAPMSAVTSGIADVKECIKVAKNETAMFKRRTVLFVDEIHRFNKVQQDAFLPHVEDGTIVLIGATTENPAFHVNNALLSRCKVVALTKLSVDDVLCILRRTLVKLGVDVVNEGRCNDDKYSGEVVAAEREELEGFRENDEACCRGEPSNSDDNGLPKTSFCNRMISNVDSPVISAKPVSDENREDKYRLLSTEESALECIAGLCDGDARSALNTLHTVLDVKAADGSCQPGHRVISLQDVKDAQGRAHVLYDRAGDEHFNCVSALHKSIRGSNDNAAIYWLARMLEGGEDVLFIARRLVVCASEDIDECWPIGVVHYNGPTVFLQVFDKASSEIIGRKGIRLLNPTSACMLTGLADSQALPLAVSTFQACQFIGMPECSINLAHCVTYLARAKKSREAYSSLSRARQSITDHHGPLPPVPQHLQCPYIQHLWITPTFGSGKSNQLNSGKDGNKVVDQFLPTELRGANFFE